MIQQEKIETIADTYGYDAQSRQCIEEMAELTRAINKFWRKVLDCGKTDLNDLPEKIDTLYYENLIEEISDVSIMLQQLQYLLQADIVPIVNRKLDSQIERMGNNGD